MRARAGLLAVAALLAPGIVGVGLDVAHVALFSHEPVVAWTLPGEEAPTATFSGTTWPVAWGQAPGEGRLRWEGTFPADAPLGVWLICTDRGCHALLRLARDLGLLEVRAAPGATLTVGEHARLADGAGRAFFVVVPGEHELVAAVGADRLPRTVTVRAGERTELVLILAAAEFSTTVAQPGRAVTLSVRIVAPRDLPTLDADLVFPQGWVADPNPGLFEPLAAGEPTTRSWRVSIPADAPYGEYALTVGLPDLGTEVGAVLTLADRLPPRVVVGHWDIAANQLDLSLPGRITYERLLWATTFVGRELPFTGRVLTRTDLDLLAEEWRSR